MSAPATSPPPASLKNSAHPHGALIARIERVTDIPMLILSLLFLGVFLVDYTPGVAPELQTLAAFGEQIIVAIFAAELVVKVAVADRRLLYLRTHWIDVIVVLVPFLRPLRLLRLLPVLLRAIMILRRLLGPYRGAYVITLGLAAVLGSAVLVTMFERESGGAIKSFDDALWWAVTTITTVGYGDMTPVTPEGRAVAIFLMIVGIALFGILTAGVAAYFVENTDQRDEVAATLQTLTMQVTALERRMDEQNRLLAALLATNSAEHSTDPADPAAGDGRATNQKDVS